ncbi:MAG: universal stress protein [Proteobacteria bacterium]|nr:universal stress protein [Pseudomonadota bacterium]
MLNLKKILVPTDCSRYSVDAAVMAAGLSEKFDSEITLLYIVEDHHNYENIPAYVPKELRDRIREDIIMGSENMLKEFWEDLKLPFDKVKMFTRKGDPFTQILTFSKEADFDLLVMGTHGRNGLAHIMMGSVAERVVRHSKIPVLTIKHSDHEYKPIH